MARNLKVRTAARLTTILVAFGLFGATVAGLWGAFGRGGATSSATLPDLARIRCGPDGVRVETPRVQVHSDGIHLLVDGIGEPQGLTISGEFGSVGTGFAPGEQYPLAAVIAAPTGKARIACGLPDATGPDAAIEFVDPVGLWHDERLACIRKGTPWHQRAVSWFYTDSNELPRVLPRIIPGVLDSDELSYGNYPSGEYGSNRYRLIREGDVIATFTLHIYDERSFIFDLTSCDDSGVGGPDSSTVGNAATPFDLPPTERCDPYGSTCTSVFVSAATYASARHQDGASYVRPQIPWDACLPDQPQGCLPDPDDYILELLMSPAGAQQFIASHGCGTRDDPCLQGQSDFERGERSDT